MKVMKGQRATHRLTKFCKKCCSKTFDSNFFTISKSIVELVSREIIFRTFFRILSQCSVAVNISITCFLCFAAMLLLGIICVCICIVILYPCSCVTTIVGLCGLEVLTRFIAYGVYFV